MSDWIRERGRADYHGWKLYIVGDEAHMYVGHPWIKCAIFWTLWRLGFIKDARIVGVIRTMWIVGPDRPLS